MIIDKKIVIIKINVAWNWSHVLGKKNEKIDFPNYACAVYIYDMNYNFCHIDI